jgi:hypothetical protein
MDGGITVRPQLRQLQPTGDICSNETTRFAVAFLVRRPLKAAKEAHSDKHKLKWDEWI